MLQASDPAPLSCVYP